MSQQTITNNRTESDQGIIRKSSLAGRRAAREILLLSTTTTLSYDNMKRLSTVLEGTVDWKYLFNLVEYHRVGPLIAYNLTQNDLSNQVPALYLKRLSQIYTDNVHRNVLLSNELVKILSIFNQNGIDVITLKGSVLGEQLYVNPGLRTTHDIDILVQPDKVPQAGTLLQEMEYSESTLPDEIEHPFHRVYYKTVGVPFMVELHWDLNDPKLEIVNREELWRRARHYQFQGGTTMVLSPEDMLVYISTRLLTQDGQHFKHLADITELLKKNQDNLDWDYIIDTSHSLGITATTYYTLKWAQELLGAPVPEPTIMAIKPSLLRRCLIGWLVSHKILLSPTGWIKLRSEITTLARSMMMSRIRQTFIVLAKYRGSDKKAVWLRTLAWIPLVFGAALWLNVGKLFYR
jgi:hypothetical protein